MTENEIDAIRKRLEDCPIPENAQADWEGSNHYEIHDPTSNNPREFWWLELYDRDEVDSSTEQGKRVGAVLDYACAYRRDVGTLLERTTELGEVRTAAINMLEDLDNATGPDEWSTSELRDALAALPEPRP